MNIALWLYQTAQLHPQRQALMRGMTLHASYAQFARRAATLAQWMQRVHGVQAGDRVALYMANCCEYLEVAYAVWWLGAVVVPINFKLHPSEAAWIVTDAQAKLVFSDTADALSVAQSPAVTTAPSSQPPCVAVQGEDYQTLLRLAADTMAQPLPSPATCTTDALAWLFYTSGTTGRPKGVMLSHGNLVSMSLCYPTDVDAIDQRDALLYAAPMSHGAGLYNFIFVRHAGQHIVPPSRGFQPDEILQLASEHGSVSLFAAPTMVNRLVAHAERSGQVGQGLKTVVYGGGPMYLADLEHALQVLGNRFVQIYGQGESPMTITALSRACISDHAHPRAKQRRASVGVAQSCVEVRVVDAELRPLPVGEAGEVLVRGATVMHGYWRNPEASAQTLVDGWLRTGDVGRFDADGFLTLTDRLKDVVISGGSNIYPREVEEVLLRHPAVREASVIGRPSAEWGEEVVAMVVLDPANGSATTVAELDRWCRTSLAAFKAPKRYGFCADLPKNSYGKILKTSLRELLERMPLHSV